MAQIFISYRRDLDAGHAIGLRDRLIAEFGREQLFIDLDAIPLGENFVRVLNEAVAECKVLVAIVGPGWLDATDESGRRRLDESTDFVRIEIAEALRRQIPVIPILFGNARMPRAELLPDDLKELAQRLGLTVRYESFDSDINRLIQYLKARLPAPSAASVSPPPGAGTVRRPAPPETGRPAVGTSFKDTPEGPIMVVVPAGEFVMGSPPDEKGREPLKGPIGVEEGPQHKVTIKEPFAVGKYPVTVDEFSIFASETGYAQGDGAEILELGYFNNLKAVYRPDLSWRNPGFDQTGAHPVTCVSWHDAKQYTAWLSNKTNQSYRLLSESEWEYACRAGTTTAYSTGNSIASNQARAALVNVVKVLRDFVTPMPKPPVRVGSFAANAFGLHDMHGNVFEWCEDTALTNYGIAPADGTAQTGGSEVIRIIRGGSWAHSKTFLRSACRCTEEAGKRSSLVGFRVARAL